MSDLISRKALLEELNKNISNSVDGIIHLITNAPSVEQGEPVAWAILAKNGRASIWWSNKESAMNRINANDGQYDTLKEGEQFVELYTSPPQPQTVKDALEKAADICDRYKLANKNYAEEMAIKICKLIEEE